MSKLEHTLSLMNKLMNIYKTGGVKRALSNFSFDDVNPSTHTCGRLFAHAVQKVAFVVSILFLSVACQKATLISSEDSEKTTRGTDEEIPTDSTDVNIDFEAEGWEGAIDAGFEFGGEEE